MRRFLMGAAAMASVLFFICSARLAADSASIETIVKDELARLNGATGFNVHADFTQGGGSDTSQIDDIQIDTAQMQGVRQQSNVRQFREVIRLVLAHEFGHQLQFRRYGTQVVNSDDFGTRQVYEAQADILAGKYLMQTIAGGDVSQQAATQQGIEDALQTMFDLGVEVDGSRTADHPTHDQRLTAVRYGMAVGIMAALLVKASQPGADPRYAQGAFVIAQKADIVPAEDPVDWMLREARKIVHYDSALSSQVSVADRDIHYDTSADHPFVTYRLIYENNSDKMLSIDLDVQCLSVPRGNPGDLKRSQVWSSRRYQFVIGSGQQHTVAGELEWHATRDLMPQLLFPPRSPALMMVTTQ